mgnify:CR=1 FL=1
MFFEHCITSTQLFEISYLTVQIIQIYWWQININSQEKLNQRY